MNRILRTLPLLMLTACMLRADAPYNYVGAKDVFYSLANLPTPPKPPDPADGDGIRLVWYKHWAPPGAVNPQDTLIDYFDNPFNNGRAWANIITKFQIDRVVTSDANLDANGFLLDPQGLIAQGVISPTVTVEFTAIQYLHGNGIVKTQFGNGLVANYKLVSVNGRKYWSEAPFGPVSSWDDQLSLNHWKTIKLQIPVSMIKFPSRAPSGSTPLPMENHLELTTDLVGNDYAVPGFQVAWSKATVKAMAPIFLVHGTNADHTTWEAPSGDSFIDYFTQTGGTGYLGAWDYHIDLSTGTGGNGTIQASGLELNTQLGALVKSFGAKGCHLIAHSKGGSDSRKCIEKNQFDLNDPGTKEKDKFKILSLYTIGTPHKGTVLSDISYQQNASMFSVQTEIDSSSNYDIQQLMDGNCLLALFGAGPRGGARFDQQTSEMMTWYDSDNTSKYLNGHFYSIIADADVDNDKKITLQESRVLIDILKFRNLLKPSLGTWMYRTLGYVRSIQTTRRYIPNMGNPKELVDIEPVYDGAFVPNDMVGTVTSAMGPGATRILVSPYSIGKDPFQGDYMAQNHSTMKNRILADQIVQRIISDFNVSKP